MSANSIYSRVLRKISESEKGFNLLRTRFQKLDFDKGLIHLRNIESFLKDFMTGAQGKEPGLTPSQVSRIREYYGILSENLSRMLNVLEDADKSVREIFTPDQTEALRFQRKFGIVRQIQDARKTIAGLEKEKNTGDKDAESRKFEEKFRILHKIQEIKAAVSSLVKEKVDIEKKGDRATPADLARKLDIVAQIAGLKKSETALEDDIGSLDAKIKSDIARKKFEIIEKIHKEKDRIRLLESRIATIEKESSEVSEKKANARKTKERAEKEACRIISKNEALLNLLTAMSEKSPADSPEAETETPLSGMDKDTSALIEKLKQFGCKEGVTQIFNLHESFSLFKEILAKRINPEIGAFERYFLRGFELYENILNDFENMISYLRATRADKEEQIANRLNILNLKENKSSEDYDEIFETTPVLNRIREARTKLARKIIKIKKAIEMIREETLKISLREGYYTQSDLARKKFRDLASKRNQEKVSLNVAIRNFQETCTLNKRILDRFEQESIQHRRHRGH